MMVMPIAPQLNIIRNGLVLWVDASVQTSYPGSGTTWNDLSGNGNNGTLVNGPTYNSGNGGYLQFTGANDYATVNSFNITTTDVTFTAWLYRTANLVNYTGIIFSRGTSIIGMGISSSNRLGYHPYFDWNSNLTLPLNTWCMACITITSTQAIAYLCQSSSITKATNTASHESFIINALEIGRDKSLNQPARNFQGMYGQVTIYNRALSENEITHNFNVTRRRFGI